MGQQAAAQGGAQAAQGCRAVHGLGTDLIREARLAASLRHPAYVQIYAVEEDGDGQTIVMELIDGLTLKQVLSTGPIAGRTAVDIVRQVAEAMEEAHQQGLVHGDLKPSNIMLERSGKVRILDFGLAAHMNVDATTSSVGSDPQGTIAYMAPELLSGALRKRAQRRLCAGGGAVRTAHRPASVS
ncbi:serine/threonine protein kinase [Massilia sp. B-10]|nr:serine/threonine protein kinase [Massilia sp. B-10]